MNDFFTVGLFAGAAACFFFVALFGVFVVAVYVGETFASVIKRMRRK